MPFSLKSDGATYQRLMKSLFSHKIGQNIKAYVDGMIVKNIKGQSQAEDLEDVLQSVRKYNINLNPTKCSFGVQAGKLLGFIQTKRFIEANPYKWQTIIAMSSPTNVKEV